MGPKGDRTRLEDNLTVPEDHCKKDIYNIIDSTQAWESTTWGKRKRNQERKKGEEKRERKVENKKTRYWQISCHCSSKVVSRMFLGRFSYLGSLSFSLRDRPSSSRSNLPIYSSSSSSSFFCCSMTIWASQWRWRKTQFMVIAPGLSSLERESKTVNYYGRVWVFKLRFLWVFTDSELGSLRRDARGCGFKVIPHFILSFPISLL